MASPIVIDRLHAVRISDIGDNIDAAETLAAPESIRHLPPFDFTGSTLKQFVAVLGIASELKIAASGDGTVDVRIIDRALAKTHLTTEEKIRAKIAICGSGFERH
jgi:hypothetical protein